MTVETDLIKGAYVAGRLRATFVHLQDMWREGCIPDVQMARQKIYPLCAQFATALRRRGISPSWLVSLPIGFQADKPLTIEEISRWESDYRMASVRVQPGEALSVDIILDNENRKNSVHIIAGVNAGKCVRNFVRANIEDAEEPEHSIVVFDAVNWLGHPADLEKFPATQQGYLDYLRSKILRTPNRAFVHVVSMNDVLGAIDSVSVADYDL